MRTSGWAGLAVGVIALLGAAGCGSSTSGSATFGSTPAATTTTAPSILHGHGYGQLRFRPVLIVRDAGTTGAGTADNRQPTRADLQAAALTSYSCPPAGADPLADKDDPQLPLISCDQTGKTKYLLGPVFLDGSQITSASAARDPNGTDYFVNLSFNASAAKTFGDYTAAHVGDQLAIVLDTEVLEAPTIQSAILGGQVQISGNFTAAQAQGLAAKLAG